MIALLIGTATALEIIFDSEIAAQIERDSFNDYPTQLTNTTIIGKVSYLDDDYVYLIWEMKVMNNRDNKTETLPIDNFKILINKKDIDNKDFVDQEVQRISDAIFKEYNESFKPNPKYNY